MCVKCYLLSESIDKKFNLDLFESQIHVWIIENILNTESYQEHLEVSAAVDGVRQGKYF